MSSNRWESDKADFSVIKCISIPTEDSEPVIERCKQLQISIKRQQLTPKENFDLSKWLIKLIRKDDKLVLKDVLSTLHCLLKNASQSTTQVNGDLIGEHGLLWKLLNDNTKLLEIHVESFKCLHALITQQESSQSKDKPMIFSGNQLQQCINLCIHYLYKKRHKDQNELHYYEIIIYACKILLHIYSVDNEADRCLNENVGACKYWMLFGIGDNNSEIPQKVAPSQQTVAEVPYEQPKKGGKRIKLRKSRNMKPVGPKDEEPQNDSVWNDRNSTEYRMVNSINDETNFSSSVAPITSESDISDSENNLQSRISSSQAKIRLSALNLLSVLIRTSEKHIIFGYWWSLLPDIKSNSDSTGTGLALVISQEPTVTGRLAGFTALLSLITASRTILLQADSSKHATLSFTPFSVALGITIENIHRLLSKQFEREHSVPLIVGILKCTAAIVQSTPYNKLGGLILLPIIKTVKDLLSHKEWTIQVAALIVMGCIISVNPPLDEVLHSLKNEIVTLSTSVALLNIDQNKILESEVKDIGKNLSWLVNICFQNLGWTLSNNDLTACNQSTVPTRLESLQVLSVISLQYFDQLLSPFVNLMLIVLSSALEDNSAEICFHAAKCISSMGDAMQKSAERCDSLQLNQYVQFWTKLLQGALTKILQMDQNAPARAIACDCIGTIGEKIFLELEENLKILSATLLLGSSGDDDILVRAAAVRALAVCIMYQQWREDLCLVSDCSEMALRIMSEQSPAVQVKASWALANITDALVLNTENIENESIDNVLFNRLLKASIAAATENDKIKMNVMRALGNLMFLMNDTYLKENKENQENAMAAIQVLNLYIKVGKNMKVRWNACHALGKSFKNMTLYTYLNQWQSSVLENLCNLILTCRNLKVCTHASAALCSPSMRHHYGTNFISTWTAVLQTLNNTYHTEDFTEYKHKTNLIEQLCVTLSHLACLLTDDDLIAIYNSLCFYWEIAEQLLQQVVRSTQPQSPMCQKILDAAKHVTTYFTTSNDRERQSINMLQNMFVWEC